MSHIVESCPLTKLNASERWSVPASLCWWCCYCLADQTMGLNRIRKKKTNTIATRVLEQHRSHPQMQSCYTHTTYAHRRSILNPASPTGGGVGTIINTSRDDRSDLCLMSALPDTTASAADTRSSKSFSATNFSAKCLKCFTVAGVTDSSVLLVHRKEFWFLNAKFVEI